MKTILSIVSKTISWILFIGVFASIGFATENPSLMVPAYGVAIIVILGTIVFFLNKKKRQLSETSTKISTFIPMIGGILLLVLSFIFPAKVLSGFLNHFNITSGTIILFTFLLLGIGFLGVWMINVLSLKNKLLAWLGYFLIILAAAIPALVVSPYDSASGTLGVLYFVVIVEAILFWAGFTMFFRTIKKQDDSNKL